MLILPFVLKPVPVQLVALAELHVSVDESPAVIDDGLEKIETVGINAGVGVPVTYTITDLVTVPPGPLQVKT